MTTRRIKVRGTDQRIVLGLGALAGVGLAVDGLHPTGSMVVDWILLVLVGVGAAWAAASAPWWALSLTAAIATALAPPVFPVLIGAGVFGLSLAIGATRRSQPIERAAVAGGTLLVLSMARELRWFGVNSLVAISLVVALAGLGLWRRSRKERRLAFTIIGAAAAFAAIGGLGLAAAAAAARPDLSEGNRTARQGLRLIKSGDFHLAQEAFGRAAASFERADSDLGAPWAQPARLLPIASQHRTAGAELAGAAADATAIIERQLRLIDLDSLRIVDGRIDIDAVRALRTPMAELQLALDELGRSVTSARSGWLIDPIQTRLDDLQADIDEQQALGSKAIAALKVAPALLGAEGERVYFVMFTTPAEARGQGGLMGNYAELTIDDGSIAVTTLGRTTDLNPFGRSAILTRPADWLANYGGFGFQKGPERLVGPYAWSNITLSPHFPSTARVVADLYPQSGGRAVDGVFSLDVYALQALVGIVGPLDIEGVDEPLTGSNTAKFLLVDQYEIDQSARVDLLEDVARQVMSMTLEGSIDDPVRFGTALAPPARERRLMAWSNDAAEQDLLRQVGIDGALFPADAPEARMSLRIANAGGNKIDTYLERQICIVPFGEPDRLTAVVRLINHAPSTGLPQIVIGNLMGLPDGVNRTYVTWHSSLPVDSATADGQPLPLYSQWEQGAHTYSAFIEVPANNRVELRLSIRADIATRVADGILVSPQPLVMPESWEVETAESDCFDRAAETLTPVLLDWPETAS